MIKYMAVAFAVAVSGGVAEAAGVLAGGDVVIEAAGVLAVAVAVAAWLAIQNMADARKWLESNSSVVPLGTGFVGGRYCTS